MNHTVWLIPNRIVCDTGPWFEISNQSEWSLFPTLRNFNIENKNWILNLLFEFVPDKESSCSPWLICIMLSPRCLRRYTRNKSWNISSRFRLYTQYQTMFIIKVHCNMNFENLMVFLGKPVPTIWILRWLTAPLSKLSGVLGSGPGMGALDQRGLLRDVSAAALAWFFSMIKFVFSWKFNTLTPV